MWSLTWKRPLAVLILLVGSVGMTGCHSTEAGAIGGATGITVLQELLVGAGQVTDRELALLAGQEAELARQKAEALANDNAALAEKLDEQLEDTQKATERLRAVQDGISLGQKASETDWNDPASAAPWLTNLIPLAFALMYRKQNLSARETLSALRKNLAQLTSEAPPEEAARINTTMNQHR